MCHLFFNSAEASGETFSNEMPAWQTASALTPQSALKGLRGIRDALRGSQKLIILDSMNSNRYSEGQWALGGFQQLSRGPKGHSKGPKKQSRI